MAEITYQLVTVQTTEPPIVTSPFVRVELESEEVISVRASYSLEKLFGMEFTSVDSLRRIGGDKVGFSVLIENGNGRCSVFTQTITPYGISAILELPFILSLPAPKFFIKMYSDEEKTKELPKPTGTSLAKAGTIYITIQTDRLLRNSPIFDVFQSGFLDITNRTTSPIDVSLDDLKSFGLLEGFDDAIDKTISIDQLTSVPTNMFGGYFEVNKQDGFRNIDGPARIEIHAVDLVGNLI